MAEFEDSVDSTRTIPITFHGDGAPTTKVEGLVSLSWGSCLVQGTSKLTRFVYTVVKKSDFNDGTVNQLLAYFAWAANVLFTGTYPEKTWRDRPHPLAGLPINSGGWRMAVKSRMSVKSRMFV